MEILPFLLAPFLASLILTGIHAYLGVHVVERGVIFVDLALAQIPDAYRHGTDILIRSSSAGATKGVWPTFAACANTANAASSPSASPSLNRSVIAIVACVD